MNFGEYDEVHDDPSPTNSMKSRTWKCLGLGPTSNLQDYYKFIDMTTGNKLMKQASTKIPIPYAITKIV